MVWNAMNQEQMEAQLLRQAQLIGVMREALERIDQIAVAKKKGAIGEAQKVARAALK